MRIARVIGCITMIVCGIITLYLFCFNNKAGISVASLKAAVLNVGKELFTLREIRSSSVIISTSKMDLGLEKITSKLNELSIIDPVDKASISQSGVSVSTESVEQTIIDTQPCLLYRHSLSYLSENFNDYFIKKQIRRKTGNFGVTGQKYQLATRHTGDTVNRINLVSSCIQNWPTLPTSDFELSKYEKEFEEDTLIASGGFGKVFKTRNRLDDMNYAVKKICIPFSDIDTVSNHISEVKTFARLSHPNIVSYKAAWLEPLLNPPTREFDSDGASTNASEEIPQHLPLSADENSSYFNKKSRDSDFEICFESSTSKSKSKSKVPNIYNNIHAKWATLYIQMALCDKTLKEWLADRSFPSLMNELSLFSNKINDDPIDTYIRIVINIFTQLTQGLDYIHGLGIVHHDVKPSNIFIGMTRISIGSSKYSVQLGDFGLACPFRTQHKGDALGTPLYAAPEQLKGQCNRKSDLYSMGVIFLELIEIFATDMEKVKMIEQFRNGTIPTQILVKYPKLAHIIGKLIEKSVSKRITTKQLLKLLEALNKDQDKTIKRLRNNLFFEKKSNIALRRENMLKAKEIARLKTLLSSERK